MKTSTTKVVKLFLLAILAELVILCDSLSAWIASMFSSNIVNQTIIRYAINYTLWIIGIIAICLIYKKNPDIHFKYNEKPTSKNTLIWIALLLLTLTISVISWGGFKVYKELFNSIRYVGVGLGIANFVAQYIYYFLEVVLMVMILAFTQEAGELLFRNIKIPYGGFFLALIWGLDHIAFHGLIDGTITTICAIIYGFAFLVMRKNPRYAYWLIFLMFIL